MNDWDFNKVLDAFLELGPSTGPDRVGAAARREARETRQTVLPAWWPSWRFPIMNSNSVRYGLAAAAVIFAVIVGIGVFRPGGIGVGPSESQSLSPTPLAPSAVPSATAEESLVAWRLRSPFPIPIDLSMPNAWESWTREPTAAGVLAPPTSTSGSGWGLFFFTFTNNLFADPCDTSKGQLEPVPGPSVDDLVEAMMSIPGLDASEPTETEIDGYRAVRIDLTSPAEGEPCADGAATVNTIPGWEEALYRMSPGETVQFRIVDVDGQRLVILATDYPQTSNWEVTNGAPFDADAHAQHQVELREILASIDINP